MKSRILLITTIINLLGVRIAFSQNMNDDTLNFPQVVPFAINGSEKMIYDKRMGPQAIFYKGKIYIVYLASEQGQKADPYIIIYDQNKKQWSCHVKLGENPPISDHHYAPILWIDREEKIHVLYKCHIMDGGIHIISKKPLDISEWENAVQISNSITYPHLFKVNDEELLLYYRKFGHMGFWGFQKSNDGGNTWGDYVKVIDFDQDPLTDLDTWACTYQSVTLDEKKKNLLIGFVHYDESMSFNPKFNSRLIGYRTLNRYHLYFVRYNIKDNTLYNIENLLFPKPLNRFGAENLKVLDVQNRMERNPLTRIGDPRNLQYGHVLTTIPSIVEDIQGQTGLLLPVASDTPWNPRFVYFKQVANSWISTEITTTNNMWSESFLQKNDSNLNVWLISGKNNGEPLPYGGGEIEKWSSNDNGQHWEKVEFIQPDKELIYNNPKPVIYWETGKELKNSFIVYGCDKEEPTTQNTGKSFLMLNNAWISGDSLNNYYNQDGTHK